MDVRSGFWSLWPPRWTMGRAVTLVFPSSPLPGRDNRDSVLLAAALDIAHLAMKTVREGSLSSDELLRMHRCTEVIRYLSAAGLIPTKQENSADLQTGGLSSSPSFPMWLQDLTLPSPLLHASEVARVSDAGLAQGRNFAHPHLPRPLSPL